jgi:hypothetical protein
LGIDVERSKHIREIQDNLLGASNVFGWWIRNISLYPSDCFDSPDWFALVLESCDTTVRNRSGKKTRVSHIEDEAGLTEVVVVQGARRQYPGEMNSSGAGQYRYRVAFIILNTSTQCSTGISDCP